MAQGFKEDAVAILLGLQIGFAGVINPLGGVAMVFGVDDLAVVQVEVEGVVGLAWVVGVAVLGFPPGDDLALILQHRVAGIDGTDGVDALAVDARFAHLGAATTNRRAEAEMDLAGGWFKFFLGLHQLIIKSFNETKTSKAKPGAVQGEA